MRLKSIAFMLLLSGLSACSTTQKPQESENLTTNVSEPEPIQTLSAQQLYQQAQNSEGATRVQLLNRTQNQAINEQNWSLLLQASDTLLRSNPEQQIQAVLLKSYAQAQMGEPQRALQTSRSVQSQLQTPEHFYWHQLVQGTAYMRMQMPQQSAPFLLRASETANRYQIEASQLNPILWRSLQSLSPQQLTKYDSGSAIAKGWVQLAKIKQLYLGSPVELHQASNNWQRRYPGHPASFALDEKVAELMKVEPYNATKLAVILPLSGANKGLGEAVKSGVLAALDNYQFEDIYFIDANLENQQLTQQLNDKQIDFAVGPLLKSNINRFEQHNLLEGIPSIYLNRSDIERQSLQHYYFALAPEHELDQALAHFMAKGFEKPLILAPNERSGQRLSEHFSSQWQRYNEQPPLVGLFDDNKEMEKVITELLEVDDSEARIDAIEGIFKRNVKSETRSRRDIDVVYLLANATQTRLLKPYLDVNVSTFVERIPLYASSKSHSTRIDSTDKRDLNGLYFTELPWMLPTKGLANLNTRQLRERFDSLWPDVADIEQRLFAMGYDAISLIPQLRQLSMLPGKSQTGLTGELSVISNGEIVRHLAWARYQSRSINKVSLEHLDPTPLFMKKQFEESSNVMAPESVAQ